MKILFSVFNPCLLTDDIPPAAAIPPAAGSRPALPPPAAAGFVGGRLSLGGAAAVARAMQMERGDVVEHTIAPHCIKAVYKGHVEIKGDAGWTLILP